MLCVTNPMWFINYSPGMLSAVLNDAKIGRFPGMPHGATLARGERAFEFVVVSNGPVVFGPLERSLRVIPAHGIMRMSFGPDWRGPMPAIEEETTFQKYFNSTIGAKDYDYICTRCVLSARDLDDSFLGRKEVPPPYLDIPWDVMLEHEREVAVALGATPPSGESDFDLQICLRTGKVDRLDALVDVHDVPALWNAISQACYAKSAVCLRWLLRWVPDIDRLDLGQYFHTAIQSCDAACLLAMVECGARADEGTWYDMARALSKEEFVMIRQASYVVREDVSLKTDREHCDDEDDVPVYKRFRGSCFERDGP